MIRGWMVALALVPSAGCSLFLGGDSGPSDAVDGSVGGDSAVGDGNRTYTAWDRTVDPASLNGTWQLGGGDCTIDTDVPTFGDSCDSGMITAGTDNEQLVISVETMTLAGSITITGIRPVVIITKSISTAGGSAIRAVGQLVSAPTIPGYCTGDLGAVVTSGAGGGGLGGAGETGGGGIASGATVDLADLTSVVRGCPGGAGGGLTADGGGGLHLIATESISINGLIVAHGAGGAGGAQTTGGGGGGSGGMVVLDSPSVELGSTAAIAANGGSGGSGGSTNGAGLPGTTSATFACTVGGSSVGGSGVGGAGGCYLDANTVVAPVAGTSGTTGTGGGGGGGGVGFILLHGDASPVVDAGKISPPIAVID